MVSNFERPTRRERREKGRRRRRGRGREDKQKGMEILKFFYGFKYGTLNFVWKPTLIMDSMRFGIDILVCMMIILLKPRVLLGFHLNPKFMESKVEKNLR